MAKMTTRKRIKWQASQAIEKVDDLLIHLQAMDEIAEGGSPYIDQHLPIIVVGIGTVRDALRRFKEGL